jgi:hypothetical protein
MLSSDRVKRSIAKETERFDRMVNALGLSEDGRDYAKLALDPFHDTELRVVGKPNSQHGRSLTFNIERQITITKPSSLAAGEWDCHIASIPSCRMTDCGEGLLGYTSVLGVAPPTPNALDKVGSGVAIPDGVVVACCVLAGDDTFDPHATDAVYESISIDSYLQPGGRHDLVSFAFEVHNVTADLTKQGSVTTYRHENRYNSGFYGVAGGVDFTMAVVHTANAPPRTLELAKAMSAHTWEAAEGALVPGMYSQVDAAPRGYIAGPCVLIQDNGYAFTNLVESQQAQACFLDFKMDSSGAYFTGLSEETALTVTLRCILEVFPSPSSDLMALAHPSPDLDLKALELVSHVQSTLRAGYPVSENGFGDFFRGIASTVGKIVHPVAHALRNVPLIGSVAGNVDNAIEAAQLAGKAKAKPKPKAKTKKK